MFLRLFLLLIAVSNSHADSRIPANADYRPGNVQSGSSSYRIETTSNQLNYELLNQLEVLQQEVQLLRGQLEEQDYVIETLQKRQNTIYSDIDQRLRTLEGGGAADNLKAPVQGGEQAKKTGTGQDLQTPLGTKAASAGKSTPGNEKQDYQDAYKKLRNGHYNKAIIMLERIIIDYPDGDYADNAQYWLGEAYKVNQDINSARIAFAQVIANYPDSPKVPDAMLKLGYIEADQQNWQAARKQLNSLVTRFPGTTAANLATEKLTQMERDKH